MRKYILFLIIFSVNNFMYSQSEKEIIEYKADGIYVVLQNDKGEQLTKIPFGKGVFIYYDTFFKSIEILYENREGQIDAMKLLFLGEKENDGVKYLQMKDAFGGKFSVFGNIAKSGVLIIIMEKKTEDGNIMLLTITGAKKQ